jgi:L-tyrosine isonitrile synthase
MFKDNASSAGAAAPVQPLQAREFEGVAVNYAQHRAAEDGMAAPNSGRPGKNGSPQILSHAAVAAAKVLRSFNTWAFKREQPADPHLMLQFISAAIALEAPIRFVLYWGKGPRCNLGLPDIECLDYLAALARRVRAVHAPGAAIKLIFTDTHAALNGHSPAGLRGYFGEIDIKARQYGFETCWLGHIIRAAGAAATSDPADDALPDETLRRLAESAKKWYRGEGTAEQGALKYYRMNMIEKRAVEIAFPRSIFITFNGSDLRNLFPTQLPIFFMYSLRRGTSVKPWFVASDATVEMAVVNLASP